MTRRLTATMLSGVATRPAAAGCEYSATEVPQFRLCQGFVEAAALGNSQKVPAEWFVDVKLTQAGTAALTEFTGTHLGEVVQLLVGSSIAVETQIQAIVDSGQIRSRGHDKPATEALSELFASLPSTPREIRPSTAE